jgi:hypothetical protein
MIAQILSARASVQVAPITKVNFKIDEIVMSDHFRFIRFI